jgi:hypothetical protein
VDADEGDVTTDEDERLRELVRRHVAQLSEHFDAVHIFVSAKQSVDGRPATGTFDLGAGNWYARLGQVREWLVGQDEVTRHRVRQVMNADAAEADPDGD